MQFAERINQIQESKTVQLTALVQKLKQGHDLEAAAGKVKQLRSNSLINFEAF